MSCANQHNYRHNHEGQIPHNVEGNNGFRVPPVGSALLKLSRCGLPDQHRSSSPALVEETARERRRESVEAREPLEDDCLERRSGAVGEPDEVSEDMLGRYKIMESEKGFKRVWE
ncbi:UNVERIFIED_CONTAM: hypothetical protein Sradi_6709600 [Sesamum radiatum]|uniref:Uncharacterized protein n=1 Tax=Sesamum radiatum TaxID=300843 RepID=A0AAW2JSF2_SESRA